MRNHLFLYLYLFLLMGCGVALSNADETMTHRVETQDMRGRKAYRTETTSYRGRNFDAAGPIMPGYGRLRGSSMGYYGYGAQGARGYDALADMCARDPNSLPGRCPEREIGVSYTTTPVAPPPALRPTSNGSGGYDESGQRLVVVEKKMDVVVETVKHLARHKCEDMLEDEKNGVLKNKIPDAALRKRNVQSCTAALKNDTNASTSSKQGE